MLAPTPCLDPTCQQQATNQGRCPDHQRPRWQGSTRSQRLPRDWKTRRLIVLKRDKGICYVCGQPGADRVDHIVPNDNHQLSNLAAIHDATAPHCHRTKSSTEGHQAKAENRTKPRH